MKFSLKSWRASSVLAMVGATLMVALFVESQPVASQKATQARNSSCLKPTEEKDRSGNFGCAVDGKPTPRTPDGHPNFSGLWTDSPVGDLTASYSNTFERSVDGSILYDASLHDSDNGTVGQCVSDDCQRPNQPPYKSDYMEKVKGIAATFNGNTSFLDPEMECKPWGIPRGGVGGAMQIVQTPDLVVILYEGHPQPSSVYRMIYMNSEHPADFDTTYLGDSRGHWEGDTLVVDVTGLSDETWLGGGGNAKYTTIHSDKEHVIERWTRQGDIVTYQATVEDPVMFTRPWVLAPRRMYVDKTPGDQLQELFCNEQSTGFGHFPKPTEQEQKRTCSTLNKADYDACVAGASK